MADLVWCERLKKEGQKLEVPPFPGTLGKYIFDHVCAESFNEWVEFQTKLINENRLDLSLARSQEFLYKEMTKFLFENSERG